MSSEDIRFLHSGPLAPIKKWGTKWSLWPVHLVTACCGVELAHAYACGYDAERIGSLNYGICRQTNVIIVEGAITRKMAKVLRITWEQMPNPKFVIVMGACGLKGGLFWNSYHMVKPSEVVPVDFFVPGCPPNPHNFLSTVLYFLTFKKLPPTDKFGRPLFAYGRKVHDHCERRPHFDEGRYAEQFGDLGHRMGFCLYKVGCKGPETYSNCPVIRFNDVEVWPVSVGNGCCGCTEPNFWDTMTPFHKRLPNIRVPGGKGIQASATEVGKAALGVTAAALAIHAGVGIAKRLATGSKSEE